MKRILQAFLIIMGIVLMMAVENGVEQATDLVDAFWIAAVFTGAVTALLVAIRIDKLTE